MPDKRLKPPDVVWNPQIIENREETERWAEEKERGKPDEEFEVGQEFEDEKETKGWEEGKQEREL